MTVLATVLREVYEPAERRDVHRAISDLCPPNVNIGWSPRGIYAYWDLESRRLLYIGLASSLARRFAEHNGLVRCDPSGCKFPEIAAHQRQYGSIGLSLVVGDVEGEEDARGNAEVTDFHPSDTDIRQAEGFLIEVLRRHAGGLAWNKIGGATFARSEVAARHVALIDELTGRLDTDFVARRGIRELAADPTDALREATLHSARLRILLWETSLAVALDHVAAIDPIQTEIVTDIRQSGYLDLHARYGLYPHGR